MNYNVLKKKPFLEKYRTLFLRQTLLRNCIFPKNMLLNISIEISNTGLN
jgi:hypothetical protein